MKLKKSFPPWVFNTGQNEFGQENGVTSKRSLDEADSGGPNVETSERARRSSDVCDP